MLKSHFSDDTLLLGAPVGITPERCTPPGSADVFSSDELSQDGCEQVSGQAVHLRARVVRVRPGGVPGIVTNSLGNACTRYNLDESIGQRLYLADHLGIYELREAGLHGPYPGRLGSGACHEEAGRSAEQVFKLRRGSGSVREG